MEANRERESVLKNSTSVWATAKAFEEVSEPETTLEDQEPTDSQPTPNIASTRIWQVVEKILVAVNLSINPGIRKRSECAEPICSKKPCSAR